MRPHPTQIKNICLCSLILLAMASIASAHFLTLLPSAPFITAEGTRTVNIDILFTHPMEQGPIMEMAKPKQFGMLLQGQKTNLLDKLVPKKINNKTTYIVENIRPKSPGDCIFYIEPAPYWEPAEEKMIVHYTKLIVNAYGEESGWDDLLGFPVEIQPLTRPYGIWTGNLFRGIVLKEGKPAPFAEVEVEYYNRDKKIIPPADSFITQVIKADANGTFAYAMPRAGWWGFAALIDGDEKMKSPDGKMTDVELGGLIWVNCTDMK